MAYGEEKIDRELNSNVGGVSFSKKKPFSSSE